MHGGRRGRRRPGEGAAALHVYLYVNGILNLRRAAPAVGEARR